MSNRNLEIWFQQLKPSITSYNYYTDFKKAYRNVNSIKIELHILNALVGSQDIYNDFINIINEYPKVLKCIPILLAIRDKKINVFDKNENIEILYDFFNPSFSLEQYMYFMEQTGLFDLLKNKKITNVCDYVTGIEVGLDSNGRKNRTGDLMEDIVESYIIDAGFKHGISYFKEMNLSDISKKWNVDLSKISNDGKTQKRFDFVVKTDNMIYLVETNFYSSSGSKLNETARSYKNLAIEAKEIPEVTFVWFTDGIGWKKAKNNLIETFSVLDTIYNIEEMKDGIIKKVFK